MTRERFVAKLVLLAEMCGKTVSKELIGAYDQNLEALGYAPLCQVLDEIILNRNDRDPFPSIKTIREYIAPTPNCEREAIDAANRILEAITRIGYCNEKEARDFIGELGWLVVQRQGGWIALCENTLSDQVPILKAQWRELAKALFERAKAGRLDTPPGLPLPDQNGKLIKLLTKVKSL